jgi:glycosyltransferase involved in cell wall biosynthesis
MKTLVLAPFLPFPEDMGMRIKLAKLMMAMGRENVFLLAFREERERIPEEELKKICSDFWIFPRPQITRCQFWSNHFSLKPLLVSRFFSPEAARTVSFLVETKEIEAVLFESLLMAPYLNYIKRAITIYHAHNIETIRAKRRAHQAFSFGPKIYYYLIAWRFNFYETRTLKKFDYLLACSSLDKAILEQMTGKKEIFVLPNIIDTDFFRPIHQARDPYLLIFLGTLWYQPNEEAAIYFLQEILPLLTRSFPAIRLEIIGEGASPRLIHLAAKWGHRVKILGKVEDIRPYLARAGALVAPILSGSGTRTKILTALAMELPVISTSIGCEGLEVEDGQNILVADKPIEFREKIGQLISDPELRERLARNGRTLVEKNHSPQILQKSWLEIQQQIGGEMGKKIKRN